MNNSRKGLTIAIILLFIGLAVAPNINANLEKLTQTSTQIFEERNNTHKLSCRYYTLNGIEEIEKEISFEDAEHLSQLMDSSDFDAIAAELAHLDLVPESMSIHQIKEMLSGEYGRKHYIKSQEKIKNNHFIESNIKRNIFCNVSGDAGRNYLSKPTLSIATEMLFVISFSLIFLDFYFQQFSWYPTVGVGDENVYFQCGLLLIIGFAILLIDVLINKVFDFISPKAMPYSIAFLEDDSNINTSGMLGKWNMHNQDILLNMIGFLGLWIHFSDYSCKFKGFALYVVARGKDN